MQNKFVISLRLVLVLGSLLSLSGGLIKTVQADGCTWWGVNSNWDDISNWSCGHVPTSADDVVIPVTAYNPIINDTDIYRVYANNLTIQSGAAISVPDRLEIIASNVDVYGTLETTGTMDSAYIRGYATINNYGLIDAHAGTISIHYGGTHTGTFQGQYGEIMIGGENYYTHTFSPTCNILVKKIYFYNNKPINIQGTFRQLWGDSRVTVDHSEVTISFQPSLLLGSVTTISGSLTIDFSGTATGSVSVPANTSLVGTGTVDGDLLNAGTVKPGASPGTINVTSNFTQESTGTLAMEIGGTTDTDHDQLVVTGTATLYGTLDVSLISDFIPTLGDSFTLMTYASHTGTFATENLQALDPGLAWQVTYGEQSLILTVVQSGGTIDGTVTYIGVEVGEDVTIGLFTDPSGPPAKSVDVEYTDGTYPYTFSELGDDTYYIGALMDFDGDDQPDPNEPFAWYDPNSNGEPDEIIITDGTPTHTNIDFDLTDPSLIQGTVTYTGSLGITGPISVSAHPAVGAEPSATAEDIQSGETYSILGLTPGSYYISAYLDVNNSGGPPDAGEPFGWYDSNGDGTADPIVISTAGEIVTGKDILLEDSLTFIYLPLILR